MVEFAGEFSVATVQKIEEIPGSHPATICDVRLGSQDLRALRSTQREEAGQGFGLILKVRDNS